MNWKIQLQPLTGGSCQHPDSKLHPDEFHPESEGGGQVVVVNEDVLDMCGRCPVRAACAESGRSFGGDGIWGGVLLRGGKSTRYELNRHTRSA